MNFGLTEDQEHLRHSTRMFLDEQCPLPEVRRLIEENVGYSPKTWKSLASLGWSGLITDDTYGGAGLGWIELIVLLEETGRSLFPSPLISTLLTSSFVNDIGSDQQKQAWLPRLADGTEIGTLALFDRPEDIGPHGILTRGEVTDNTVVIDGRKAHVLDAPDASVFVVAFKTDAGDLGVALVPRDAAGVEVIALEALDQSKRVGHVTFSNVEVPQANVLGDASQSWPAIARVMDQGAVAMTAEMLGAGEAALALTVQYAKDRTQFGSPIGRFQGVKHPLAEIHVELESTRSLLYYAAWALEESPKAVPAAASAAKAYATESFTRIGVDAIQLHGAVGYTEEYDIQLYLKRSKFARPAYGDEDFHLERVATLGGL
ncbi:MAG: alkylation response protein AidB-like acyl-CoA dehydrogenase [Candidatus Binatia bacterium]|jgi:alkylation response protein AidB-like acyl-CoA dehydrogenase